MSGELPIHGRARIWIWLWTLLVALGCQVRLATAYDEIIDRGASDLHTDIAAFVGKMATLSGKPEGTYDLNQGVYPEFLAKVSTLRMRAAAAPKNQITVKLLDELSGNLERLRLLHQMGKERGLNKALAGPALSAIDVNCSAIIQYELAKRRNES